MYRRIILALLRWRIRLRSLQMQFSAEPSWFVQNAGWVTPLGFGLAMSETGEYGLALVCFAAGSCVLLFKVWHWRGFENWPISSFVLKAFCGLLALAMIVGSYPYTEFRKGDRPWSSFLASRWGIPDAPTAIVHHERPPELLADVPRPVAQATQSKQEVRITRFEPIFDSDGLPTSLRVHIRNDGMSIRTLAQDRSVAVNTLIIPLPHAEALRFEDSIWETAFQKEEWKPITIPTINDPSLRVNFFDTRPEGMEKLKQGWTLYTMGRAKTPSGKLLFEYCVYIPPKNLTVMLCGNHN